jgi:hypothetical protein
MEIVKLSLTAEMPDGRKVSADIKVPADQMELSAAEFSEKWLAPSFGALRYVCLTPQAA